MLPACSLPILALSRPANVPERYAGTVVGVSFLDENPGGSLAGPWDDAFWFALPAGVQSKSNFRREHKSRAWSDLTLFESEVRSCARAHLPAGWDLGAQDTKKVAERPGIVVVIYAVSLLDTGNLDKSVLDALERVCFYTDASVRSITCLSERRRTDQHAAVAVARLAPAADLAAIIRATSALTDSLSTTILPVILPAPVA